MKTLYLLYNPIKHGYVTDLKQYAYSSFHELFDHLGKEALAQQFRFYADFRSLDLPDVSNSRSIGVQGLPCEYPNIRQHPQSRRIRKASLALPVLRNDAKRRLDTSNKDVIYFSWASKREKPG